MNVRLDRGQLAALVAALEADGDRQDRRERRARRAEAGRLARPLAPCGTYAAAVRHRRRREPVCAACLEAERTYQALRRSQAPVPPRGRKHRGALATCGTYAASRRHRRDGEVLDEACLAAERAYLAMWRARQRRRREGRAA